MSTSDKTKKLQLLGGFATKKEIEELGLNMTYEDYVLFLAENNILVAVEDADGGILTDEKGNVLIW